MPDDRDLVLVSRKKRRSGIGVNWNDRENLASGHAFAEKVETAERHWDREIRVCAEEARHRIIRPGLKVKIARRLNGNLTVPIATSGAHRTDPRPAGPVRVASVLKPSVTALRLILTNALSDRKTTDRNELSRDGSLQW